MAGNNLAIVGERQNYLNVLTTRVQENWQGRKVQILTGATALVGGTAIAMTLWPVAVVVAALGAAMFVHGVFRSPPGLSHPPLPPLLPPDPPPQVPSIDQIYARFSTEPFNEETTPPMERDVYRLLQLLDVRNVEAVRSSLQQFASNYPHNIQPVARGVYLLANALNPTNRSVYLRQIQENAVEYLPVIEPTPPFIPSSPHAAPVAAQITSRRFSLWKGLLIVGGALLAAQMRPLHRISQPTLPIDSPSPVDPPEYFITGRDPVFARMQHLFSKSVQEHPLALIPPSNRVCPASRRELVALTGEPYWAEIGTRFFANDLPEWQEEKQVALSPSNSGICPLPDSWVTPDWTGKPYWVHLPEEPVCFANTTRPIEPFCSFEERPWIYVTKDFLQGAAFWGGRFYKQLQAAQTWSSQKVREVVGYSFGMASNWTVWSVQKGREAGSLIGQEIGWKVREVVGYSFGMASNWTVWSVQKGRETGSLIGQEIGVVSNWTRWKAREGMGVIGQGVSSVAQSTFGAERALRNKTEPFRLWWNGVNQQWKPAVRNVVHTALLSPYHGAKFAAMRIAQFAIDLFPQKELPLTFWNPKCFRSLPTSNALVPLTGSPRHVKIPPFLPKRNLPYPAKSTSPLSKAVVLKEPPIRRQAPQKKGSQPTPTLQKDEGWNIWLGFVLFINFIGVIYEGCKRGRPVQQEEPLIQEAEEEVRPVQQRQQTATRIRRPVTRSQGERNLRGPYAGRLRARPAQTEPYS